MTPRPRGAALLVAMLVVALVATISAASLWKQWRGVEVEAAERARVQSAWLLTGALDWARLVLREDVRTGGADHLGEPWALPLQEARLTTFLAQDRASVALGEGDGTNAFLSGQITDLQSRLNVSNLAALGRISEPSLRAFARLFQLLGLPPAELARLAESMRLASEAGTDGAERARIPIAPQRAGELGGMGLAPATMVLLAPHITVLPGRTAVNLNTAAAEVIYSAIEGISLADAQRLVAEREQSPFRTAADAARLLGRPEGFADGTAVSVASRFFEVRSRFRLEQTVVEERALVQRDGPEVVVLQRNRG
jgi:general secretion pathway protein K